MRRIHFEDPEHAVSVLVDLSEEMFQDMKRDFGEKNLRRYVGALAKMTIGRALAPPANPEENA